jgi:hypothetical protein
MERYSFIKYSDYDKGYYTMLFERARNRGQFEGKIAVDFLKLSEISPVRSDHSAMIILTRIYRQF